MPVAGKQSDSSLVDGGGGITVSLRTVLPKYIGDVSDLMKRQSESAKRYN